MSISDDLEDVGARYSLDELVEIANCLLPRFLPEERRGLKLNDLVNPRLVRHLSTLGLLDEAGREGRAARYERRHLLQLLVARRLMAQGYSTGAIKKLTSGTRDNELESLLHGDTQPGLTSPEASSSTSAIAAESEMARMAEVAAPEIESFSDSMVLDSAVSASVVESREAPDAPPDNAALSFLQNIRSGRKKTTASNVPSPTAPSPAPLMNRSMPVPSSPPRLNAPLQAAPRAPRYFRIALRPGLELHVSEDFELPPSVGERETLMHDALRLLKDAHKGGGKRKR